MQPRDASSRRTSASASPRPRAPQSESVRAAGSPQVRLLPDDTAASSNISSDASESEWSGRVRVPGRARPATAPGGETRESQATGSFARSNSNCARALTAPRPRPVRSSPSFVIPSRAVARERRRCNNFSPTRGRVAAGACADADFPCVPEATASTEHKDDLDAMITVRRRARPSPDTSRSFRRSDARISRVPGRFSRQMTWHLTVRRPSSFFAAARVAARRGPSANAAAPHPRARKLTSPRTIHSRRSMKRDVVRTVDRWTRRCSPRTCATSC